MRLWQAPDRERLKGKLDRALLALLLACGLRRHELAESATCSSAEGIGRCVGLPGTSSRSSPPRLALANWRPKISVEVALGSAPPPCGELQQIQSLLGHVSVQTTERYLGYTQRIASAVDDRIGIEPKA
jgi:site-specific recombinase XerD